MGIEEGGAMTGQMIIEWDVFGIIILMWVAISLLCWVAGYARGRIDQSKEQK